jgi:GNAT superfamily N-acetyltransferase
MLDRIRRQHDAGYRLAFVEVEGEVQAVAGYRISENLAWGRFLYVDDLVTRESERSRGHGRAIIEWLEDHARAHGCVELHLDSGLHRAAAHRFYLERGLDISSYHFGMAL